jgi:hypothetical protein
MSLVGPTTNPLSRERRLGRSHRPPRLFERQEFPQSSRSGPSPERLLRSCSNQSLHGLDEPKADITATAYGHSETNKLMHLLLDCPIGRRDPIRITSFTETSGDIGSTATLGSKKSPDRAHADNSTMGLSADLLRIVGLIKINVSWPAVRRTLGQTDSTRIGWSRG